MKAEVLSADQKRNNKAKKINVYSFKDLDSKVSYRARTMIWEEYMTEKISLNRKK